MKWLAILAGLAALAFAGDRLLLWMECRGWIDYRRTYPGRLDPGRIGPALLGVQSLFEPGAGHHLEEKNAVRTEREAQGEPPDGGRRRLSP